ILTQIFRHHCYLHSFPTRRSSDLFHSRDTKALPVMFLGCPGAERRFPTKGGGANQESVRRTEGDEIHPVRASRTFHQRGYRLLRSEEHTSELQSRGHLVCRLLLEK